MPVVAGTVNRGSDVIGAGAVANDWSAFTGLDTTSCEIVQIAVVVANSQKGAKFSRLVLPRLPIDPGASAVAAAIGSGSGGLAGAGIH